MLLTGCARGPVYVSGSVTLDGKALGNANLGFTPVENGSNAVATTDTEGRFDVSLVPGEYMVAVVSNPPPFDVTRKAPAVKASIPSKYANPSTSQPLSVRAQHSWS